MNLFGSREDDPLLQNDPLAPSDQKQERELDSNEDFSVSSFSRTDHSDKEAVRPEGEKSLNLEGSGSVFEAGSSTETEMEDHFRFSGSEETRVIVRSAKETASGRLTMLNSAFDQGWRLSRVEVREDPPPESSPESEAPSNEEGSSSTDSSSEDPAAEDHSFRLAFVLQRPE